ncbi:MAG TPA: hypothetical protein VGJ33_02410 [Candidatus Angelobacter sp.]|jgi:hypothetical protein
MLSRWAGGTLSAIVMKIVSAGKVTKVTGNGYVRDELQLGYDCWPAVRA